MYLFIIIDWYSRNIVDYELSSTLDKGFVMTCLKRELSRKTLEIINSDQDNHFTNAEYIELLESHGIRISVDGKGQALDNIRTERFFRTLKYDDIYINEYNTPKELRKGINAYMTHTTPIGPTTHQAAMFRLIITKAIRLAIICQHTTSSTCVIFIYFLFYYLFSLQ